MTKHHRVVIETGNKKAFASAIDWPGWCRWAKAGDDVLDVLRSYADRYQKIAGLAGVRGVKATADDFQVIERSRGTTTTDFGAPDVPAQAESAFLTDAECARQIKLLRACWAYFDEVAARVSPELAKGPRGGGRDRDKMIGHVFESERNYVRNVGVKTPKSDMDSAEGLARHRDAVCAAIRAHNANQQSARSWPLWYFVRRMAWHVTDHAWEMEDKDLTDSRENG